jgi:uncharacterized protein (UPF0264 family)
MSGRPAWRGLLVSVREPAEVEPAVRGGAAIIDVKEPAHGPLGPAAPATIAAIATTIAGRTPWTIACGELAAGAAAALVQQTVDQLPRGAARPAAVKAGPAGLDLATWQDAFQAFRAGLPQGVEPVAVAYADAERASAPAVERILAAAAEQGCGLVLIDTFAKDGPGLLGQGAERLACWLDEGRRLGLGLAVAGRLSLDEIGAVARLGAGVVGVRGSVCEGGRSGRVHPDLVTIAAHAAPRRRTLGVQDPHDRPGFLHLSGTSP